MRINSPKRTDRTDLSGAFTDADTNRRRMAHVTFNIDPDLHRRFRMASARSGRPMSHMLAEWIEQNCPE